jgi:hypothetical protein
LQIPEVQNFPPQERSGLKKHRVTDIPEYQCCNIRQIIYDFHKTEGCRVMVKNLQQKIKDDLGIVASETSLRRILKKMGFKWRKTENNRKILIEKMEIRALRIKYLNKIQYFRSQQRPIVFLDETYLHSGHTSSKNWTDDTTKGLFKNISKGPRLIIVHAGGDMGFIPNCQLIFKSGTKSGDYHSEMNSENYGKWLQERLIPNLPVNSIVVTDNAPYHNVQIHAAPNSNSRKADMKNWLHEKNIIFDGSMLKPQLYELIKINKKRHIRYKFDEVMLAHGHTVLRLPPYHPDLNPIELIWATVKNNVSKKNITFKLEDVRKLAEHEFDHITPEEWQKRCQHVINIEHKYLENEAFTDIHTEINPLIINLNDDSSTSSSESEENHYSDSTE